MIFLHYHFVFDQENVIIFTIICFFKLSKTFLCTTNSVKSENSEELKAKFEIIFRMFTMNFCTILHFILSSYTRVGRYVLFGFRPNTE